MTEPTFFHVAYGDFTTYENLHTFTEVYKTLSDWVNGIAATKDHVLKSGHPTDNWVLSATGQQEAVFFNEKIVDLVNFEFDQHYANTQVEYAELFFQKHLSDTYVDNVNNQTHGPTKIAIYNSAHAYLENYETFPDKDLGRFEEACAIVKDLFPDGADTIIADAEKKVVQDGLSSSVANIFGGLAKKKDTEFQTIINIEGVNFGKILTAINDSTNLSSTSLLGLVNSSNSAEGVLKATSAEAAPTVEQQLETYFESFLRLLVTGGRYAAFTTACLTTADALRAHTESAEMAISSFYDVLNTNLIKVGNPIPAGLVPELKRLIGWFVIISLIADAGNVSESGWSEKSATRLAGDLLYILGLPGYLAPETALASSIVGAPYVLPQAGYNFFKSAYYKVVNYAKPTFGNTLAEAASAAAVDTEVAVATDLISVSKLSAATLGKMVVSYFSLADIVIGVGQVIDGVKKFNNNKLSAAFEIGAGSANIVAGLVGGAVVAFAGTTAAAAVGAAFLVTTAISFGLGLTSAILASTDN
jgi:hypothetical protein